MIIWRKSVPDRGISKKKQAKGGNMNGQSSLTREAWGRIIANWIEEVTDHVWPCKKLLLLPEKSLESFKQRR